jgi:hypothetical protein
MSDESSYPSNPSQVQECPLRWDHQLFDLGTMGNSNTQQHHRPSFEDDFQVGTSRLLDGFIDSQSTGHDLHLPSHHAADGNDFSLGGSTDDDDDTDLELVVPSRNEEDHLDINLDDSVGGVAHVAPALQYYCFSGKRIRISPPCLGGDVEQEGEEDGEELGEGREVEYSQEVEDEGEGGTEEEEPLLNAGTIPIRGAMSVPNPGNDRLIQHYFEEAFQLNINELNSHKGTFGSKARLCKTSKTNVDPVPPTLRVAALAAVKRCIPSIDMSNPQSEQILKNVTRAAAKICPPLTDETNWDDYETAVKNICSSLANIYPQRALFNLMSRWARKAKSHYQRDCLNVVTVLADQLGMTCVDFLDMVRTWRYLPTLQRNRRQTPILQYTRVKDNDEKFENVVNKFHLTCMLMDSSMKGKFIYFSVSTFVSDMLLLLMVFVSVLCSVLICRQ